MHIETHMHISLDGKNSKDYRKLLHDKSRAERLIRDSIIEYSKRGIYAVRDGGDPINLSSITRKIADEQGVIYKTPVHAIYRKGHYGGLIGRAIEDKEDFIDLFKQISKSKPDFVKIPLSGIMDFDRYGDVGSIAFTQDELDYMVNYVKDRNLPVMVHVNSQRGIDIAIKARVDTIEHGYYMSEDQLYALKEKGVIWIPTLAPLGNIINSEDKRYKEASIIKRIFDEQKSMVFKAYKLGVMLSVGSDAGAYKVMHGQGYFEELIIRAEENGNVKIAVENTRDEELIDILMSEIDSRIFGLCYDSSHDWVEGQTRGGLLEKWSDRLFCTHLSDNDTKEDKHWIPGDGSVDWNIVMPYVLNSKIDCVTMELLASKTSIVDPELYLSTSFDSLSRLVDEFYDK